MYGKHDTDNIIGTMLINNTGGSLRHRGYMSFLRTAQRGSPEQNPTFKGEDTPGTRYQVRFVNVRSTTCIVHTSTSTIYHVYRTY